MTKGKTLVTKGKTLVMEGKTLVTKGKTLVTGGMEGAQRTSQPCLRLSRSMNGGGDNVR